MSNELYLAKALNGSCLKFESIFFLIILTTKINKALSTTKFSKIYVLPNGSFQLESMHFTRCCKFPLLINIRNKNNRNFVIVYYEKVLIIYSLLKM